MHDGMYEVQRGAKNAKDFGDASFQSIFGELKL